MSYVLALYRIPLQFSGLAKIRSADHVYAHVSLSLGIAITEENVLFHFGSMFFRLVRTWYKEISIDKKNV